MLIKNSFTLTQEEIAELFATLYDSLQADGTLQFQIKGSAAVLEVGPQLHTELSFSENSFSLSLSWSQDEDDSEEEPELEPPVAPVSKVPPTQAPAKEDEDWRAQFDRDMAGMGLSVGEEPPQAAPQAVPQAEPKREQFIPFVREVKLQEEEPEVETIPQSTYQPEQEEIVPTVTPSNRNLPDRMTLNTTTLSYDPGVWTSSFSIEEQQPKTWYQIPIGEDLENKKWDVDDKDIASPIAPTTKSALRRTTTTRLEAGDDDLFSSLDQPEEKISKKKEKVQQKAEINRSEHTKVKVTTPIPSAKKVVIEDQVSNWKEPEREDISTGDDWVRPSEVLRKKKAKELRPRSDTPDVSPSGTSPSAAPQATPAADPTPSTKANEIISQVRHWEEPKREDIATEDEWVKPSEFLKRKQAKAMKPPEKTEAPPEQKEESSARHRKPPVAPDKKKKKDSEKGWASW
ncbi:MAG: hypothetical protein INQ03_12790 [Candidatus Heimdallarchaeota archaeon]|nr:hypothetical protein [Candidatus Heimdallarchaeota archaeon]